MSSPPPPSSSSFSRPPLLGLLNPNSHHYHDSSDPSASFRLSSVHHHNDRSSSTSSSRSSEEDDDDGPPRSFLLDATPRQSVNLSSRARQEEGGANTSEDVEPFINPSNKGSSSSSSSSSVSSSTSGSNSETTRSPPQSQRAIPQPMSLPLPVTTPTPSSSKHPLSQPPPTSPHAGRGAAAALSLNEGGGKGKSRRRKKSSSGGASSSSGRFDGGGMKAKGGLDEYDKALWDWVNVQDLDSFLQDAYAYYKGKGIYCIILSRALNLITVGFVIVFSTFLLRCVDFSLVRAREGETTSLEEVIVPRCVQNFSGFTLFAFLAFGSFYIYQIIAFVLSVRPLLTMYRFYTHLLGVPDEDVQTISWPTIVHLIGQIRESNPLTSLSSRPALSASHQPLKLDAHDIANRILRQENYLIALFNKDVLDLSLPIPFLGGRQQVLTRALEWNLRFCLMGYLCDGAGRGGVRKVFLRERNKTALVEALKRRLIFMAIVNAIFAPFIVLYLLMYSFFRYFEEYHKNPSSIGGRTYTPFAKWKFREFNELPHLFQTRLDSSYPIAKKYIDQFPKERTALVMRFISFIAGSFAAVLLLASVLDPDLVLHFEITPHRTVLFYITIFGAILAVTRGMVPEDNQVFDPEMLLRGVVHYTHYLPEEWKGKLHSQQVHDDFGQLFAMKISVFAQETLSVVLTPFVLWLSLPACAPAIIDFFREFTVHVDGVGYVCSFAVFDFARNGNVKFGAPTEVTDERLISKEGKMEKSFLNFKASNPEWIPTDPTSSLFLSRLTDINSSFHPHLTFNNHPSRPSHLSPLSRSHNPHMIPDPDLPMTSSLLVDTSRLAPHPHGRNGLSAVAQGKRPASRSPANGNGFSHPLTSNGGSRRSRSTGTPSGTGNGRVETVAEEGEVEISEREAGWDDVTGVDGRVGTAMRRREEEEEEREKEGRVPDGGFATLMGNVYKVKMGK